MSTEIFRSARSVPNIRICAKPNLGHFSANSEERSICDWLNLSIMNLLREHLFPGHEPAQAVGRNESLQDKPDLAATARAMLQAATAGLLSDLHGLAIVHLSGVVLHLFAVVVNFFLDIKLKSSPALCCGCHY